jgi:hypothetical protein
MKRGPGRPPRPESERFWEKVEKSDGCWLWTAQIGSNGYGRFSSRSDGPRLAHRVAYELVIGEIPAGLVIDHLCRNRACVNPHHMEPVTIGENVRRGEPAVKTHCKQGHERNDTNSYVNAKGHRICRPCIAMGGVKYRARLRAGVTA